MICYKLTQNTENHLAALISFWWWEYGMLQQQVRGWGKMSFSMVKQDLTSLPFQGDGSSGFPSLLWKSFKISFPSCLTMNYWHTFISLHICYSCVSFKVIKCSLFLLAQEGPCCYCLSDSHSLWCVSFCFFKFSDSLFLSWPCLFRSWRIAI